MPREIRIYFEGDKSLKAGFDAFLREIGERADAAQCTLRIVATGGTPERDFGIALRKHPGAWNILLRDSEGPWNQDLWTSDSIFLDGGDDGILVPRRQRCPGRLLQERFP
jgi:hypothetical protein